MKEILLTTLDAFIGAIICWFLTRSFFLDKIKNLKKQSNRNMERFLEYLNLGSFIKDNSLVNVLCERRREYVKNNVYAKGDAKYFDEQALNRLCEFIAMQDDGVEFYLELRKNTVYVNPEVEKIIKEAVYSEKQKVIELFEKSYVTYPKATPAWQQAFRHGVQHRYFSGIKLDYIFYDRLNEHFLLEESTG